MRLKVSFSGRVQGVGFRAFVQQSAASYGLLGWVKNLPDGTVLAEFQGAEQAIYRLLDEIVVGNGICRVKEIRKEEIPEIKEAHQFRIV